MRAQWLTKKNNEKLIIFFNGWGMDAEPFLRLSCDDYDTITFFEYTNFNYDIKSLLTRMSHYKKIVVIAWSFGVWVCYKVFEQLSINNITCIAINGTINPVSDTLGVPLSFIENIIANYNERMQKEFYYKLLQTKKDIFRFLKEKPKRAIENQISELGFLKKSMLNKTHNSYKELFKKVFIGINDDIICSKNQLNFWEKVNVPIILKDSPHFPFYRWNNWKELLNECYECN